MKFVLLGPPGSGKGTQAELLNRKFDIPHIKTENLINNHIRLQTEAGVVAQQYVQKGDPLPDNLITEIVLQHIRENCPSGFALDGFPKTLTQAKQLHEEFTVVAAIVLDVPEKEIIRRLTGLKMCLSCDIKYQIDYPPKNENRCDVCGGTLSFIEENSSDNIKKKIKRYSKDIKAVTSFYKKLGVLHTINGNGNHDEVFQEILHIA